MIKTILSLLRVQFIQRYRVDKGKLKPKTIILIIVLGICILPAFFIFTSNFVELGEFAYTLESGGEIGLVRAVITMLITFSQAAVLVFSLIFLLNVVYMSKDIEIMLALPIKPTTIYISKLIYVYINQVISNALLVIVILVPFGIGANLGLGYYLQLIPVMLISPLLPLLIATILAIPLMYLSALFKRQGAMTTILSMVLFVALFAGYYALIFSFQGGSVDATNIITQINDFAKIMLPNYLLAGSLVANSVGMYFGGLFGSLGINILLACLAVLISSIVYKKSISKQLETPKKSNSKKKQVEYQKKGKLKALLSNDLKQIMRETAMGTYSLIGFVLAPIMSVIMSFAFVTGLASLLDMIGFLNFPYAIDILFVAVSCSITPAMIISMNMNAVSAFTREGETFFIYKTLPIDAKLRVKAKLILTLAFTLVSSLLSTLTCALMFNISVFFAMAMFVILALITLGSSYLQIYIDLLKPRLHWNTFMEGAKNNPSSIWSLAIGLGIIVVFLIVSVSFIALYVYTAQFWAIIAYICVTIILSVAYVLVARKILFNNCSRLMDNLEG
ncbi:MAG: hypothetical protein RR207_01630 [Clostridia bacterium]